MILPKPNAGSKIIPKEGVLKVNGGAGGSTRGREGEGGYAGVRVGLTSSLAARQGGRDKECKHTHFAQ